MKVFVDASLLIYLNVKMLDKEAELIEDFWLNLLTHHLLYTNVLVLDETIYVSRKKYGVSVEKTLELIDKAVLPYVDVLSIGLNEYLKAREVMKKFGLKPSDAIHIATIENYGLQAIASENRDFDVVGIKRIWISR